MKLLKELAISLIGIPIAALIFITIYILTYLFVGNETYILLIESLKDFSIFAKEFITLAISMIISVLSFRLFYKKAIEEEMKLSNKLFYIFLFIIGFAILPLGLTYYLLSSFELFRLSFLIIWVVMMATLSLVYIVKNFVEVWLINNQLRKMRTLKKNLNGTVIIPRLSRGLFILRQKAILQAEPQGSSCFNTCVSYDPLNGSLYSFIDI